MSATVLVADLDITPGQRDTFVARARQHRENVLKNEPGCQRFDLLVPNDDDNKVILCEVYDDDAALELHLNTPHMKQYLEDTGPMVANRQRTICKMSNE